MNSIQVQLFGKFRAQIITGEIVKFDSGKAKELFCYLMLNQLHPHNREALMNLLWKDTDATHSRRYLRKTLWQLQSVFETYVGKECLSPLLIESEWLQVNRQANYRVDAVIFEEVYDRVRDFSGRELQPSQVQTLETAVDLYQGDLLEGWYQEWCIYERERLQRVLILMLDKLVEFAEFHNLHEQGIFYANRILRYDQARERTHRCLMRLFYHAGDRTTALRQFKRSAQILEEELGVPPSGKTRQLYEQILNGAGAASSTHPAAAPSGSDLQPMIPEMLDHLASMQAAIYNIQETLQEIKNSAS